MADIKKLLKRNSLALTRCRDCADLWVTRARLLMLEDDEPFSGSLLDVERCILKALDLAPNNLEAIEEAAHYYDVVAPDRRKAVKHAKRYIGLAGKVVSDMRAILEDS
jgi:hypothetical protein